MDAITYQVLLRHNPWLQSIEMWSETVRSHLPQPYLPRMLSSSIKNDPNKISLVIGPRQSGKSTLIWHHLLSQTSPFLLINCEERSCRDLCDSPALFLKEIQEITSSMPGLFFEEIQHLSEAGLFLKGLVDLMPDVPIFVTGSSSYHLKSKTRESLAGRAIRLYLLPFGLEEVSPMREPPFIADQKRRDALREIVLWGGYPEVYLSHNRQAVLAQLIEAFVLRDASDLYNVRRPDAYRKLLSLAASQIGNLVNFSNWAENTGVSVTTVTEYLNIMAESHIVKLVRPFVGGKRAEITSTPKIYFLDNGLRNFLFGSFTPLDQRGDYGALVENFVLSELCKYTHPLLDSVFYWRSSSGAEVDFVIRKSDLILPIEVKAGSLKRPGISRSLRSFIQAYRPAKVIVFNETLQDRMEIAETVILFDILTHLPERLTKELAITGSSN
jgi:predicted AAA+ superfamily ATPase